MYIVEFSVCKDLYCRNGGKCSGSNAAWCTCPPGYTGAFCQKSKFSYFVQHKRTVKKWLLKKESIFHNFTLMSQNEVFGFIGIIFNNDILFDIFLFSLKVDVRKTRVKMAVHVLAKTSVNVHLYIPVLSVLEEDWEPKTTRHQTHRQFLTPAIV